MSVLRDSRFLAVPWVDHGFGTRHDGSWTPPGHTAKLHQVHGARITAVETAGHHGDGDALMTATPALWLEIRTADCVPLFIVDPVLRVVAAVHAGWRGTAAAIAAHTVAAMAASYGTRPVNLLVAIGPSIGACCFAVGEEVAAHFPGHITRFAARSHVNLVSANQAQLAAAGVQPHNIEPVGLCTMCHPLQFHSFRRDRDTGRMVSAIQIRP
jgi:YfiH family protein